MLRPFELKKLQTSLFVSDHYALMVSESPSDYTFVFTFSILRDDVSKHKIRFLKVKAQRKDFQSIIPFQQETQTAQSLLKKNIEQVKIAKKKREAILSETKIDLNAYESKNSYVSKLVLEKIAAVSKNYAYDGGITSQGNITEKYKNLKIINRYKVDPSEVFFDKNYSNIPEVQELKNYYTVDALEAIRKDNSYYKSFRKISANTKIVGYATLNIPKISGADDLEIIFELYKDNNDTLLFEPKSKNLNITKYLDVKNQIKDAPSIHVAYNSSGNFNSLQLTQNDQIAKVVELKKKSVNKSGFISQYAATGAYALEKGKRQLVNQVNSISEIQIYRCTAYENNTLSKKNYKQKTIIAGTTFDYIDSSVLMIVDDKQNNAVSIKLMNAPEDAQEFAIYRRKLLPGTSAFDDYEMISTASIKPMPPVVLDKQVQSGHTYEYFVKYKMRSGVVRDSVKRLHKYLNPKNFENIVTLINSTAVGSTDDKVTVSFTVTTTLVNKETNIIKAALEKNNIYNEFADEFDKIKDKLQDLVFYKVSRTNLSVSPGLKEEFKDMLSVGSGDGTSVAFSDSPATRHASGISDIDPAATYFYEFKAFFKNPLALLRDYVKEVPTQTKQGDSKTVLMKKHMYRPYKWIQEKVKNTGTMLSEDDDGNFTEINLIEDGEAGVVASTTVSNMQMMLGVEACSAERFDLNTVIVSWSSMLSRDMYDHFVVVKEVDQIRHLIATVPEDRYIDTVKQSEAGSVIYYVIPVFKDYSVGSAARSNTIVIEPEEFLG